MGMTRYAKMTMMQRGREEEAEARFRDRRGREHYDNGRFAPMRNEMDTTVYPESRYPGRNMPVRSSMGYSMEEEPWPVYANMPRIGFAANAEHMRGADRMEHGHSWGRSMDLDKHTAEMWVHDMGQSWTMEQAKQIMTRYGYACDPMEFWVALNMMKSDYSRVASVCGADKEEFYAAMAHAFLDDKDALPGKLSRYYHAVVKND